MEDTYKQCTCTLNIQAVHMYTECAHVQQAVHMYTECVLPTTTRACAVPGQTPLKQLMQDVMILAHAKGYDVFNALDLLEVCVMKFLYSGQIRSAHFYCNSSLHFSPIICKTLLHMCLTF